MSVRNQHSRATSKYVRANINGKIIQLNVADSFIQDKNQLYKTIKLLKAGKLELPSDDTIFSVTKDNKFIKL